MNEWASRLLHKVGHAANSVMAADTGSPSVVYHLDRFMIEVEQDQVAKMDYTQEFDQEAECRASFEQLSQERIINEANKNIMVLKALESILSERLVGFAAHNSMWMKMRQNFEAFEYSEGSLKLALDSFFILVDQEANQTNQDALLSETRKMVKDMAADAQKKLVDYQKDIAYVEKDVIAAEKRLGKTKELLEKAAEKRASIETVESEGTKILSRSTTKINNSLSSFREQKLKENEESVLRIEQELREDLRALLSAIETRDSVHSASRRAFQKLDMECKHTTVEVLRLIATKESEYASLHKQAAENLARDCLVVNIDKDAQNFVSSYTVSPDRGALALSSQALSLLDDLSPFISVLDRDNSNLSNTSNSDSSGTNSGCSTPRGSISSIRSARNSISAPRLSNSFLTDLAIDSNANPSFSSSATTSSTTALHSDGLSIQTTGLALVRPPPLQSMSMSMSMNMSSPPPAVAMVGITDDWQRRYHYTHYIHYIHYIHTIHTLYIHYTYTIHTRCTSTYD